MKEPLFGKTLIQLQDLVIELGLPKFTAKQLADWLYKKNVTSIAEMSNLSKTTQSLLAEKFDIGLTPFSSVSESSDGTKKYLFPVKNTRFVEAAYIPDKERATLCVSSQVGCRMGCRFCMTARQGFQSNLTAGEIVNQIRSLPERENLTNHSLYGNGRAP